MSIKSQRGLIKPDIFRKSFGLQKKKNLGNIMLRENLVGSFRKSRTQTVMDVVHRTLWV